MITFTRNATNGLILYDISTKQTIKLSLDIVEIGGTAVKPLSPTQFVVLGATFTEPSSLFLIDVSTPSAPTKTLLKSSTDVSQIPTEVFSKAVPITFPRTYGTNLDSLSHALFLPPSNPSFAGPAGEKPPCVLWIHGGPTSHAGPGLVMKAQYFTSRGYAYCNLNYRGSTGYGRKYREELDYNWGVADCQDAASCVKYLASAGLINGSKVGITGQSSGGFTVLQSLCEFPKSFAAGCSLYGIGDLKALGEFTHKFESHYLFNLLWKEGTGEEEQEKVYKERSPCFHVGKIESPLLLLQGDKDKVVPLEQALGMKKVMEDGGKDAKLIVFEGEGHGFVMREHIKRAIEEEEGLWRTTLVGL